MGNILDTKHVTILVDASDPVVVDGLFIGQVQGISILYYTGSANLHRKWTRESEIG